MIHIRAPCDAVCSFAFMTTLIRLDYRPAKCPDSVNAAFVWPRLTGGNSTLEKSTIFTLCIIDEYLLHKQIKTGLLLLFTLSVSIHILVLDESQESDCDG